MVATHFSDFKLRWKLAIYFCVIPFISLWLRFKLNNQIINYLTILSIPPLAIWAGLIKLINCNDCILFSIYLFFASIFLFYGGIGYLIGLYIEKKKKRKSKQV